MRLMVIILNKQQIKFKTDKMEKTRTLGEAASDMAHERFEQYKRYKKDPKLSEKAEDLASSVLYTRKLIAEFAIERLEELIEKDIQK